jgi:hypothetical protein
VVVKVKKRLAMNKQRSHRFQMERFNLKKLRKERKMVKSNIALRSQIGLQLWKIWTLRWKLIVLKKRLERIQTFQP